MTASTIVLNRSLFKSIPYDPVKDFAPVAPLAIGRLALVTHPSVNAKTAKELIAFAKANPGKLFYGSPGNGTPHHLAMEVFKSEAGVDIVHVPYKGTAGAVQDLVGGQIGVMFLPVHVALPLVEAGKLNMLAAGGTDWASGPGWVRVRSWGLRYKAGEGCAGGAAPALPRCADCCPATR